MTRDCNAGVLLLCLVAAIGVFIIRPLLLLEFNEIPWEIWDEVLALHSSIWSEVESLSETFTTHVDYPKNNLSPWITWPTLHRGLHPDDHGSRFLGQPPETIRGEPIWETVRAQGKSVGVFQSLGAWPAIDPGPDGFFVPDVFGADDRCFPDRLKGFTHFCKHQVQQNEAESLSGQSLKLLMSALKSSGLTQIFWESLSLKSGTLESNDLSWSHFKSVFNPQRPPEFSTYFTNSLAGLMHRHWDVLVAPDSFEDNRIEQNRTVESLEACLSDVLRWREENPELLVAISSSMGQEQIYPTQEQNLEMRMINPGLLLEFAEIPSSAYEICSAMIPQVVINVKDKTLSQKIESFISGIITSKGRQVFSTDVQGETLSLTHLFPSQAEIDEGWIMFGENPEKVAWEDAGFEIYPVKSPTAYHIPEGILLLMGGNRKQGRSRSTIQLEGVKDLLLRRMSRIPDPGADGMIPKIQ